jgi:hypothetical protein
VKNGGLFLPSAYLTLYFSQLCAPLFPPLANCAAALADLSPVFAGAVEAPECADVLESELQAEACGAVVARWVFGSASLDICQHLGPGIDEGAGLPF